MAVTTIYPDANPETNSWDGFVTRGGVDESYATITGGNGTAADDTDNFELSLVASGTTDQYATNKIPILGFDTSAIGTDTISSAVISAYTYAQLNNLGSPATHIGAATVSSNTAATASDYQAVGSTTFGNIAYASIVDDAHNDWTLNASGISHINGSGSTFYSMQMGWQITGDTTGLSWVNSDQSYLLFRGAEHASLDPYITITHTAASTFTPKAIIF